MTLALPAPGKSFESIVIDDRMLEPGRVAQIIDDTLYLSRRVAHLVNLEAPHSVIPLNPEQVHGYSLEDPAYHR